MALIDSDEQSVIIWFTVPLYALCHSFLLAVFKTFLYFIFISLYMMWLGFFLFCFVLPWQMHWVSCMPFIKNRELSAVRSLDIVSVPFSPLFLELLFIFKLGHVLPIPNALFIHFSVQFAMLFKLDIFLLLQLQIHWIFATSIFLLIPSSDFILFQILYFSAFLSDSLIVFVSLMKIPIFSLYKHFLLHLWV